MHAIDEDKQVTVPMDYRPIRYEKHIAECAHVHEDDVCKKGEGSGPFVIALLTVSAVLSAVGAWHIFAWMLS